MSILDAIAPYKMLAEAVVIGSLFVGGSIAVHQFLEHERDIGRNEVRAEYAQKLAEAKDAARQREIEMQNQINDAVKKGQEREKTIQSMAASSAAASVSLRDTVASISNSLSSYSADTLRSLTSAYGVVSAECGARLIEVAKDAEGRNSDVQTLIDGRPTSTEKK